MQTDERITALIPHRPPFLWVDRIISMSSERIETEKTFPEDLDVFSGHYPGSPLMPGVLLCESIFQSGALLLSGSSDLSNDRSGQSIPVLTKIADARFKRRVLPGETIRITVRLIETVGALCLLKGTAKVGTEIAVKTEFSCAFIAS